MPSFRCSSDVKTRTKFLVEAYADLLQRGSLEDAAAALAKLGVSSVAEISSVLKASLHLSSFAFSSSPEYFFPAHSLIPLHCCHLDVLTEDDLEDARNKNTVDALLARLQAPECLAFSFLSNSSQDELHLSTSLHSAFLYFQKLSRSEGCSTLSSIGQNLLRLTQNFPLVKRETFRVYGVEVAREQLEARCLVLCMLAGVLLVPEQWSAVLGMVDLRCPQGTVSAVSTHVVRYLSQLPQVSFAAVLDLLQSSLTMTMLGSSEDRALAIIANVMAVLFKANFAVQSRSGIVSHTAFYSGFAQGFDEEQMKKDFVRTKFDKEAQFSFSKFPFLIDPGFKSLYLQLEALVERDAIRHAVMSGGGLFPPRLQDHFLILRIDRSKLIESTLRELRLRKDSVRHPLRVQFVGEEGVDEGGPKKEFFQLVVKELLDPNYNMFREAEGSNALWFTPTVVNSGSKNEYFLIGQVLGLAVYNNIVLDVSFPTALFRKLLGVPTTFEDLTDIDPSLASGLRDLLTFEETAELTIEEVYSRRFVYEQDVFGTIVEQPLVPGGEAMTLTGSNRESFVEGVTRYLLDAAIEANFQPFRDGFQSVCNRKLIAELRPEELEQLVRGSPSLDFAEMQASTRYDGYSPSDAIILAFWEIVCNELSDEQKKQFLKFSTGSDRVPIRGLKDLRFVIGKNGDDSELLPTSHTCFNHFLLPAYKTKAKLYSKLVLAISNCQGFGLK